MTYTAYLYDPVTQQDIRVQLTARNYARAYERLYHGCVTDASQSVRIVRIDRAGQSIRPERAPRKVA